MPTQQIAGLKKVDSLAEIILEPSTKPKTSILKCQAQAILQNILELNVRQAYREEKSYEGLTRKMAKSIGKVINHKRESRDEMIHDLQTLIDELNAYKTYREKAFILNAYVNEVQENISTENNRYHSRLNAVCQNLKTRLEPTIVYYRQHKLKDKPKFKNYRDQAHQLIDTAKQRFF